MPEDNSAMPHKEQLTSFHNELRFLLHRWTHESDLSEGDMIAALEYEKHKKLTDLHMIEESNELMQEAEDEDQ